MDGSLIVAAVLLVITSAAHSILGERYILRRLLRSNNIPHLFGSDWFTKQTLRFAWHITTVAWLGFAGLLVYLARADVANASMLLKVIAITFFVTAAIAGLASRGKHLSWPIFLAVSVLTWFSS